MRKALNENPVVQVVMLGVLGIVVAFLFMTRVMGGDSATSDTASTTDTSTTTATTAPTATPPAVPAATTPVPSAGDVAADAAAVAAGPGFEAGAGLPQSVVSAYESGDVVALLVVQRKGTEDRQLEAELDSVRGRGDTTVFVVESGDVARYSRIAEGVDLDRVPALVVIHPKSAAKGGLPVASVSYGFRAADSVEQAIRDALYKGKQLPYHPG
jgi:hypothetical protein